ncbi:MAG: ribosome maturation factor RimM [Caulobacteraceae bacterium]
MAPRLILVGRVQGAFGVKGEVRISAFTADPSSLLAYGSLRDEAGAPVLKIVSARMVAGGLIARSDPPLSREEAQALRGLNLHIRREALPAPGEEEYYLADLIGLEARSSAGDAVGRVVRVENFGAGDILEIEPADGGASWQVPFTASSVPEVDVQAGFLVIDWPGEGEWGGASPLEPLASPPARPPPRPAERRTRDRTRRVRS